MSDEDNGCLLVEADGPIRTVTLNRPEHRNAANEALHLALSTGLGMRSPPIPRLRWWC